MKIKYILSLSEIAFLNALKTDTYKPYQWSGRREDDTFRKQWASEIDTFSETDLVEKKDDGHYDSYWAYGLTNNALVLLGEYIGKKSVN